MIRLTSLQEGDICVLDGDLYSIDPEGRSGSGMIALKSKTTGEPKRFLGTTKVELYEGDLVDEGEVTDEDEIDDAVTYVSPPTIHENFSTNGPPGGLEVNEKSLDVTCGEGKSDDQSDLIFYEECCGGKPETEGEDNE